MKREKRKPLKILVIESDPDILNDLNIALASVGFDVDVLQTGSGILQNLFVVPDLFIINAGLPDADGLEICRFLKLSSNYHELPVIITSEDPDLLGVALEAGAAGFMKKPFVMQHLMEVVFQTLNLAESNR
ncbi:MAG: response regulator [Bacteroidota bacterium]|nr:response regulator [Bacteroidota bacterium]